MTREARGVWRVAFGLASRAVALATLLPRVQMDRAHTRGINGLETGIVGGYGRDISAVRVRARVCARVVCATRAVCA